MVARKNGLKYPVDSRRWPGIYAYDSDKRSFQGRPDQCLYLCFRLDGKLIWEKVGWKSEGYTPQVAAELRAERVKVARHGNEVKTHKEIRQEKARLDRTLDEIAAAYFKTRGPNMKGRGALIDRYRYEKHVAPHLGKRPASSLAPLDMNRIESAMKGLSVTSVWAALEILRRIVNFGVKHGMCPPLPFKMQLPRKNNEVTEYLTPEALKRLLSVLDDWPSPDVARMLKLAMFTGMRRGEVFALTDGDVDFRQGLLTLRGADGRGPKGGVTVSVPMSEPVRRLLEEQIEWRDTKFPDSPYLFPGKEGKLRFDCTAVYRIKKKAQLPPAFRIFHGLRHHFAVTLANSGEFTLDMIGELLTHKDTKVTRRYAKFLPDTKRKAICRAAELLETQTKVDTEEHPTRKIAKLAKSV